MKMTLINPEDDWWNISKLFVIFKNTAVSQTNPPNKGFDKFYQTSSYSNPISKMTLIVQIILCFNNTTKVTLKKKGNSETKFGRTLKIYCF